MFNFVVLNASKWASTWAPILRRPTSLDIRDIPHLFVSNEDIWVVLTYLQLRRRGLNASIADVPLPGKINILDGIHVRNEHTAPDLYLVGCRGDGHYPGLCQAVIHQNTLRLPGLKSLYVPQWSQPGLVPRNPKRKGVRTIGFFGHAAINLAPCFHEEGFAGELHARGIEFVIKDRAERVCWHDYSEIDIAISIRNIPYGHLVLKPANKLTNAWLANVPALIGREPAIEALRRSPLDYLEAHKPEQVFAMLSLLQTRPALYESMAEQGRRRAESYTDTAIAQRWRHALRTLKAQFLQWQRRTAKDWERTHQQRLKKHSWALQLHERTVHAPYRNMGYDKRWWESHTPPQQPSLQQISH